MLKLSLRPGEYIDIGENVRVIFSGGSSKQHSPLSGRAAGDQHCAKLRRRGKHAGYYREKGISTEARKENRRYFNAGEEQTVIMSG